MLLMRELADEVCQGRWLALGGGGYAVIDVVPRSWAQLIAVATGEPLDPDAPLPAAFLESAARARIEHGLRSEERRVGKRSRPGPTPSPSRTNVMITASCPAVPPETT